MYPPRRFREIAFEELRDMRLTDFPSVILVLSFLLLFVAALIGDQLRKRMLPLKDEERDNFGVVLGATLTLLGLLIGFSFSMAVSRYDQRKNYEEAEANAIGTAFLRADLLSTEDAAKVRQLLRVYVERRIDFYRGNKTTSPSIGNDLKTVQDELWSTVVRAGAAQPNPVLALAVS